MKKHRRADYYKDYWRNKTKEEYATQKRTNDMFFEGDTNNLYSTTAPMREYDRITRTLYKQFSGTDIKVKGTNRITNVYAEAYRLMTNKPTSTRAWFGKDLQLLENIDKIDVQKTYIANRFRGMAETYEEVDNILEDYLEDEIDYYEFIEEIEDFRETNKEYLKNDYGKNKKK